MTQQTTPTKQRLEGIDLARIVAFAIVILFHTYVQMGRLAPAVYPFISYINGNWGSTAVSVFFAVSGAVIAYNYADLTIQSGWKRLGQFYYKRWLRLFIPFYIVWGGNYIYRVLTARSFFYKGHPLSLILTALGMDGYLYYRLPAYYIVGEWFFGAIILLYLLYPLINFLARKNIHITLAAAIALAAIPLMSFWKISGFRNLFSCLVSFVFGMYYVRCIRRWPYRYLSIPLLVVLLSVNLPISGYVGDHIIGWVALCALDYVGEKLTAFTPPRKFLHFIGSISFETYLVHHVIISAVLQPGITSSFSSILGYGVFIVLYSLSMGYLIHAISSKATAIVQKILVPRQR